MFFQVAMKKKIAAIDLVLFIGLLAGCAPRVEHARREEHSPDLCKYRGNSADENYCAIPVVQLFADPAAYDRRKIFVHVWATTSSGHIYVFPTKDSVESADTVSSLALLSGKALPDLLRSLEANNKPMKISVGGVFVLNRQKRDGMTLSAFDSDRFGAMVNVDSASID
jgi:hypothetical protein